MKKRATFYVEEDLLKRAKVQAATEEKQISDLVSEALKKIVTISIDRKGDKVFLSGPTIDQM